MGGIGSGRYRTTPPASFARSEAMKVRHASPIAWSNVKTTLASTRRHLKENPDYIMPAQAWDMHKYVIDREEGKATIKIDANVQQTVTLDPSKLLEAMRELDTNRAQFMLNSGAHATGCEETASENVHSATSQSVAGEGEPPIDTPYAIVPDGEVGWPGASALRNVSAPPEKNNKPESGLYNNGGGI